MALKKVRLETVTEGFPITAVREIKILKQLCHSNVIHLIEVITSKRNTTPLQMNGGKLETSIAASWVTMFTFVSYVTVAYNRSV